MRNLQILDCTLRDGGYVNNWDFGRANIARIILNLLKSNIDIVECGFLSNRKPYCPDKSIFDSIDRFKEIIPYKDSNSKFVCMINYGEFNLSDIPDYDGSSVDGIRVVFHKRDLEPALEFCRKLKEKGYLLFIQPMVTINYSDYELLKIVKVINEINPYAFYIVDSFGVMRKNDLLRMFYLIDNNLDNSISVGYHSHNNLQLAYSNSQALVEVLTTRSIIIDSSVLGMGRGAGNLNTELFIQYLNNHHDCLYNVNPLLKIIDETLSKVYATNYWGYSLPYYLSALYNCHPNYASYLSDKNTLGVEAIRKILSEISPDNSDSFNKSYIEELYTKYQKRKIDDSEEMKQIKQLIGTQEILVIAPGQSIDTNKEYIQTFIKENNLLCISVNFVPIDFNCQYTFISNAKRYESLIPDLMMNKSEFIITSNIDFGSGEHIYVNYETLLNSNEAVSDNATLMLLKLLVNIGVKKVFIAGFDGYSNYQVENYFDKDWILNTSPKQANKMNKGITEIVSELMVELQLEFITPSRFDSKEVSKIEQLEWKRTFALEK